MLKHILKISLRNIWKNKLHLFTNIFGLSLSITVGSLVFFWMYSEITYDNYHFRSEDIYRVTGVKNLSNEEIRVGAMPYALAQRAAEQFPEIETATKLYIPNTAPVFSINNKPFTAEKSAYIDENWFEVFKYEVISGNPLTFFEHSNSIALTESQAKKYFGDENPIGRYINVDTTLCEVRLLLGDNPPNSSLSYDFLLPIEQRLSDPLISKLVKSWAAFFYITFVRVERGSEITTLESKFGKLLTSSGNAANKDYKVNLNPLSNLRFDSSIENDGFFHTDIRTVRTVALAGLIILVIACINYVNLSIARSSIRRKEVGLRKTIGALRPQLLTQFLFESFMTNLLGLILAFGLIALLLPIFYQVVGSNMDIFSRPIFYVILIIVFLVTAILSGGYPAIIISSQRPLNLLNGAKLTNVKQGVLRKGLIIFQFGASMLLIASMLVISRQMQFIRNSQPGYEQSSVVSVDIPISERRTLVRSELASKMKALKARLEAESTISEVTFASESIINISNTGQYGVDWDGRQLDYDPFASIVYVDQEWFTFFNLELADGKWYPETSMTDTTSIVLNEAAIHRFGIKTPVIGQRFYFPDRVLVEHNAKIIGVVKDFPFRKLDQKIAPLIIVKDPEYGSLFVKSREGSVSSLVNSLQRIWKDFFPDSPFNYRFMDEEFNELYKPEHRINLILNMVSIIAVLISVLGLWAFASLIASRRTKEIGIRKVLGASSLNITILLSKDFIKPVLIAILIASPVAWYIMSRWLQDFAYRIDLGWWMFALAGLLAVMIALLTVSFQSVRAALMNPVKSLRSE